MKPVFDEVLLLCPEAETGGPEAIHQLAYAINQLGDEAELAYLGSKSKVAFVDGGLQCTPDPGLRLPQIYAAYKPRIFI